MKKLMPDEMFLSYRDVTAEMLSRKNIQTLLVDIDNTLAPYETAEPDEACKAWIDALTKAGIRIVLISNNNPARVELFNQSLGLPAVPESGKPGTKKILAVCEKHGIGLSNAACLGDQLLTDAWLAHKLEAVALIVPPIKDKSNAFFRWKRRRERKHILRYMEMHPDYTYPFEKAAGSPEWKKVMKL